VFDGLSSMSYRTVVVGTDGSETAQLAVRHAGKVAADNSARLVIVTAYEPHGDELVNKEAQAPEDIRWALTDRVQAEELAQKGREIAKAEGASGIVAQATPGSPADVLLEAAHDFDADVIVVGSKGLSSSARFVLGSVASTVSHHAPCDVLIVHTV
jgi:nucleotide-binding universal stress UspA family protein